ncbi:ABC transporter substrate-binding protein, partial [Bacillus sp. HC-Mk]
MYLKTMVKEAGGNPDTVKVVDVGFDLVPALITKKVDAVTGAYINHEVPVMRHEGQHLLLSLYQDYHQLLLPSFLNTSH